MRLEGAFGGVCNMRCGGEDGDKEEAWSMGNKDFSFSVPNAAAGEGSR